MARMLSAAGPRILCPAVPPPWCGPSQSTDAAPSATGTVCARIACSARRRPPTRASTIGGDGLSGYGDAGPAGPDDRHRCHRRCPCDRRAPGDRCGPGPARCGPRMGEVPRRHVPPGVRPTRREPDEKRTLNVAPPSLAAGPRRCGVPSDAVAGAPEPVAQVCACRSGRPFGRRPRRTGGPSCGPVPPCHPEARTGCRVSSDRHAQAGRRPSAGHRDRAE